MNNELKEAYQRQSIVPPVEVWTRIESTLDQKNSKFTIWFWIFFSAISIGSLTAVIAQNIENEYIAHSKDYKSISFEKNVIEDALDHRKEQFLVSAKKNENKDTKNEEFNEFLGDENHSQKNEIGTEKNEVYLKTEIKNESLEEGKLKIEKNQLEGGLTKEMNENEELYPIDFDARKDMSFISYLNYTAIKPMRWIEDTIFDYVKKRKSLNEYKSHVYLGIHYNQLRQNILDREYQNFDQNSEESVQSNGLYLEFHQSLGKRFHVFVGTSFRRLKIKGQTTDIPVTIENPDEVDIEDTTGGAGGLWLSPSPEEGPIEYCINSAFYEMHGGFSYTIMDRDLYSLDIHAGLRTTWFNQNEIEVDGSKISYDTSFEDYSFLLGPQLILNPNKRLKFQLKPEAAWNWNKKYNPSFSDSRILLRYNLGIAYSF